MPAPRSNAHRCIELHCHLLRYKGDEPAKVRQVARAVIRRGICEQLLNVWRIECLLRWRNRTAADAGISPERRSFPAEINRAESILTIFGSTIVPTGVRKTDRPTRLLQFLERPRKRVLIAVVVPKGHRCAGNRQVLPGGSRACSLSAMMRNSQ